MQKRLNGSRPYPWDRWFRHRGQLRLKRGKDYRCQPHSMSVLIRAKAQSRGLKVRVLINDDVVTIVRKAS